MRKLVLFCLAVHGFAISALAQDLDRSLMRLAAPDDGSKYSIDSDVAGCGLIYLPDSELKPDELQVRARLYRPVEGDLRMVQEEICEALAPIPNPQGILTFGFNFKRNGKALTEGKYLIRVDCLEKGAKKDSKPLVSATVFLTAVDTRKGQPTKGPLTRRSLRAGQIAQGASLVARASDVTGSTIGDIAIAKGN